MLYKNELDLKQKYPIITGVDEAGRGPLAGPVVAAAVIFDKNYPLGLNDSKKLSEKKRNLLYTEIIENCLDYQICVINAPKIDEINILNASLLAMYNAISSLKTTPNLCLIDGNKLPKNLKLEAQAIVKGDAKYASIAAASILAKVYRDNLMFEIDKEFPNYGFAKHKGYPTKAHLQALNKYGPCKYHRKTYGPVAQLNFGF